MQSSSGDHNEQDHYSLSFPTSQASFYNVSQSSIPGLLRLVNTPPMGLPAASTGGLPSLTGHGGYIPGSGLKRTAHDVGFLDQPKCETTADSDKYITCHSALSQQTVQSKNHQNSAHTPMKKTKGRVKIKMEFIDNKLRRYTTFSKRKTGIMKKAYELSTLTGTQVMLLVASETGHVYTFATRKLQPMITSEAGKALIQTCLNSPDPPPLSSTASAAGHGGDQRMSATGFEETELCYTTVNDDEQKDLEDGDYAEDDDDSDAEKPAVAAGDHNSFNNGTHMLRQNSVITLQNFECVPGSSATSMSRAQSQSASGCTTVAPSAAGLVTTASSVLTNQLLMDQLSQQQQLTALQLAVGQIPSTRLSRLTPPPSGTNTANDSTFNCGMTADGSMTLDGGLVSDSLLLFGSPAYSIPAQPVKPEHVGSPPPLSSSPTDLSKSKIMHGNL